MRQRHGVFLALVVLMGLLVAAAAVLLHSPTFHGHMAALHGGAGIHGGGPAADLIGESGGDPAANPRFYHTVR